jgi:hypothetical protein
MNGRGELMFILNHVSYADNGTPLGVLGPHGTLNGAQKAAGEYEEDWRGTVTGRFDDAIGWEEVDEDDWGRHLWFRNLYFRRGLVGAVEIFEFDGMGD